MHRHRERLHTLGVLVVALLAYHLLFGGFFPNAAGRIGSDYSYALPQLLAGRFWAHENGIFQVPWFTPSFCGGLPLYADPQSFFYSVPQLLALAFPPSGAAYATMLLFASLGFLGMRHLLRTGLEFGSAASDIGAILFMFNGFFSSRMLAGHLTFHAFMLLPWAVWALVSRSRSPPLLRDLWKGILAGLCGAYFIHSGMVAIVLQTLVALALSLLAWVAVGPEAISWRSFTRRSAIACMVALGLSASKIVAAFSYLASFPRTDYPFPMLSSFGEVLSLVLRTMFLPSSDLSFDVTSNVAIQTWAVARHELEYGLGPASAILVLAAIAISLRTLRRPSPGRRRWPSVLLLLSLLPLPICLNVYDPEWHRILKSIPIVQSSSVLFRWLVVYIPLLTIIAAFAARSLPSPYGPLSTWLTLATTILGVGLADRSSYHREAYNSRPTDRASAVLDITGRVPPIREVVGAPRPGDLLPDHFEFPNDAFVAGISRIDCYPAIFGYRLEHFPRKDLHTGPPDDLTSGHLNFKNPACYVWPLANRCSPGDHFASFDALNLQKLLRYKPYPFATSSLQSLADTLSQVTFWVVLWLVPLLFVFMRLRRSNPSTSGRPLDLSEPRTISSPPEED